MDNQPTPRVNGHLLPQYLEKEVIICGGPITQVPGGKYELPTSDGRIIIVVGGGTPPYTTSRTEVHGVVLDKLSIKEISHVDLNDNFGRSLCCCYSALPDVRRLLS